MRVGRQSEGQLPCGDVRAVSHLSVVQDLRDVPGDRSFKHALHMFSPTPVTKVSAKSLPLLTPRRARFLPRAQLSTNQSKFLHSLQDRCHLWRIRLCRELVEHRDARAGERHQLIGYQVDEHVRHRTVERLEGEPSQVARAGADTTQWHLGHALGGKAGNEAVAQVAHTADVDVAHRVVVSTRKNREEVEVLQGSFHGVVRVLQAAQLHLRLQEAVLLPGCTDGGHVLPRVGQQVNLRARVVVPKSHERSHEFREGACDGDVVLRTVG